MNMPDKELKNENATIVIVTSTALGTMQRGGVVGITALTKGLH
jgi:hypothetical protein